jgi:hypothetical protein
MNSAWNKHLLRGLDTTDRTEPMLDAEYCMPMDMLDVEVGREGGRDPVLVRAWGVPTR